MFTRGPDAWCYGQVMVPLFALRTQYTFASGLGDGRSIVSFSCQLSVPGVGVGAFGRVADVNGDVAPV